MPNKIFDDIPVRGRFKTSSGTTFRKTSFIAAVPITDSNGKTIPDGVATVAFQKTSMLLELL